MSCKTETNKMAGGPLNRRPIRKEAIAMTCDIKIQEKPDLTQSQTEAVHTIETVVIQVDSLAISVGADDCEFKTFRVGQYEGVDFLMVDTVVGKRDEPTDPYGPQGWRYRYLMVTKRGGIILLNPRVGDKKSGSEALTCEPR